MQSSYAFSATIFFTAFAALVAVYGGVTARYLVVVALLLGAISQFLAQEQNKYFGYASLAFAWAAIGLSVVALVVWE